MRSLPLFVPLCALITLNGCAYFIPPDPNVPRHNTVLGGPRRPQLNLISAPLSALPAQPNAPTVAAAPVEPVAISAQNNAPVIPPVDAAVKAQAERELQANAVRALPPENQQFQVAGNYPALDAVPPRPALTGTDSAQSRLSTTQSDLERERVEAQQRKDALARDAAAEPSLLSPVAPAAAPSSPGTAPSAAPINLPPATLPTDPRRAPASGGASLLPLNPETPVASASPAPRITLTEPQPYPGTALPAVPTFAPPAPLTVASLAAPERQPVRAVPSQQPAPDAVPMPVTVPVAAPVAGVTTPAPRITLRPPADYESTPANPQLNPASTASPFNGITVQPGDFNPLTGGQHSSLAVPTQGGPIERSVTSSGTLAEYASSEAIAPSRYGVNPR